MRIFYHQCALLIWTFYFIFWNDIIKNSMYLLHIEEIKTTKIQNTSEMAVSAIYQSITRNVNKKLQAWWRDRSITQGRKGGKQAMQTLWRHHHNHLPSSSCTGHFSHDASLGMLYFFLCTSFIFYFLGLLIFLPSTHPHKESKLQGTECGGVEDSLWDIADIQ